MGQSVWSPLTTRTCSDKKDSQKHVGYRQNPAEANFDFKERLFEVHPLQAAKRNLHPSRNLFAIFISSGIDDYEYIMKK